MLLALLHALNELNAEEVIVVETDDVGDAVALALEEIVPETLDVLVTVPLVDKVADTDKEVLEHSDGETLPDWVVMLLALKVPEIDGDELILSLPDIDEVALVDRVIRVVNDIRPVVEGD